MTNQLLFLLLACATVSVTSGAFPNVYRTLKQEEIVGDPGEPLLLTPLIEQNRIEEARSAAEVDPSLFLGVKSYAGYFTVSKVFNSNLFFWFFPSQTDYENDPVVLWLQGGPGATSLFGLFDEHGPFIVNSDLKLELREYSWSRSHSVIYIDNPIGTGYSFSRGGGYARNETKIGQDLYDALLQFFTLFPELQENPFYATGESYAGKYVPALGYTILKENPGAPLKINLQGLAMGNGLTDPLHQLNYGDYLFQLGLIDSNTRLRFKDNEKEVAELIHQGQFRRAIEVLNYDHNESMYSTATGFHNWYNYMYAIDPIDETGMARFIQSAEIRAGIHVGIIPLDKEPVYENLQDEIMQSVAPWITELLSNYRVLFYNGQLDVIVAYPLTVSFLQNLEFSASEEYKTAERHIWCVENEIAGYVKEAGNLTEVLVRNSGHMVPSDQPKWAADLIYRFTRNQPLYERN